MSGKVLGEWVEARAEIISGEEAVRGMQLLNKKYFPWKQLLAAFASLSRRERSSSRSVQLKPASGSHLASGASAGKDVVARRISVVQFKENWICRDGPAVLLITPKPLPRTMLEGKPKFTSLRILKNSVRN